MSSHRGVLALAILLAALLVAPAEASSQSSTCQDGITVVVDPGEDTNTTSRCADLAEASALEALAAAGHAHVDRPGFPGMVCQIDNLPDPCNGAPATAYWSLWIAEGSRWTYSTLGAATTRLVAGDQVGWAFGAGAPPRQVPNPADRAPGAEPSTTSWWGVIATVVVVGATGLVIAMRARRRHG